MSLQTYEGTLQRFVDSLLDFEVEPEEGSENPFRPGVSMQTPKRSFTVELVPEAFHTGAKNQLRLRYGARRQSLFYRIYSPNGGKVLGLQHLPRVQAFDAGTGEPAACPTPAKAHPYLPIPQLAATLAAKFIPFEFKIKSEVGGSNSAIPAYLYALNRMGKEDVAVVRFKAPLFANTFSGQGVFPNPTQTRYWSLCLQNFARNETLACLPDFMARQDSHGMVTVVVGRGEALKTAALYRGHNFLPDTRQSKQKVMGFVYRNLVPEQSFQEDLMYQGEYFPQTISCTKKSYLDGSCF